ncbi:protein kinase [Acanthamoeba castellanii str. Neff]|uniref:non-specific serine/threonine protein kinase n=1 Tax=Acanthamoeba castellanii (strain ATCC 30010 / Neff) TaxID=1257118 RepID=L8GP72_ACACF|nr:protein kinase [Acanthamoeba castellanii str. Neff]ELR14687.1 protein kinase [Acanthamoeba castellanii str. Neff]
MSNGLMMEGFLVKEGGSIKTWKKRWCTLRDGVLSYHAKKGGELKGEVALKGVDEIQPVNYKSKKKNCFAMVTPDRTYHFSAESDELMSQWVTLLCKSRDAREQPQISLAASTGGATKARVSDFEPLYVIGRGSFGKVLQVKHKNTGKIYAMKVLNKKSIMDRNEMDHTKAEKSILMKLSSPFLVKLYYSFQTTDKLYFIMDYINGGELFCHLQKEKKFTEERVRFYSAEIVLGLEYLHNQGVIYRDLKPENLLLTADGHICMTDFGISKEGFVCKGARTATFCGTPEYLAPEVLEGQGYGKEVDWWSFGTLMYEMLTGLPPFYCDDVQVMYSKIMNEKLNPPKRIGEVAIDLLMQLLERSPSKRLCDPEKIKAHPFFSSIDWAKLAEKELIPPYIPPVKSALSVAMIDPSFTNEDLAMSPTGMDPEMAQQAHVADFTYVAPSAIPGGQ